MAEFNQLERLIALGLSRFPGVKKHLKFWFQKANYLLGPKPDSTWTGRLNKICSEGESFFGYYDKCPESPDSEWILFHNISSSTNPKEVNIKVIDKVSGNTVFTKATPAFNYQIGSRLQWIDKHRFIFNNYSPSGNQYCAEIHSIPKGTTTQLELPIFDCTSEFALCIDFKLLASLKSDYGYYAHRGNETDSRFADTFIIKLNLDSGNTSPLLSKSTLLSTLPNIDAADQGHYVNHLMISPDGKSFIFIHRWKRYGKVHHRLIWMDLQSLALKVLNTGMTSHCCWVNEKSVMGYMEHEGKTGYFLIDVESLSIRPYFQSNPPVMGDGHPSVRGEMTIFDTYPDRNRMQQLFLYQNGFKKLGSFFSPLQIEPALRCDLHPRFGRSLSDVYFDSKHEGKRHLYVLHLND